MTREQKLSLIIGFCLILITSILVADYFAPASTDTKMVALDPQLDATVAITPGDIPSGTHDQLGGTNLEQERLTPDGGNPPIFLDRKLAPGTTALGVGDPEGKGTDPITMGLETNKPDSGADGGKPGAGNTQIAAEKTYILRQGETMYSVARKFYGTGSLSTELTLYNRDALPSNLIPKAGTKLRIPDKSVLLASNGNDQAKGKDKAGNDTTKPKSGESTPPKPDLKSIATKDYVIKSGDTLDKIAAKLLGTSKRWKEIADLNPNLDPKKMKVGQTIKVPAK